MNGKRSNVSVNGGELPAVSLSAFPSLREPGQYTLSFMETCGAIRLSEDGERVLVGLSRPADGELRRRLRLFHRKPVEFFRVDAEEFASTLARFSSPEGAVRGIGTAGFEETSDGGNREEERLLLDRLANDAPVVNLVNGLLIEGIRSGASDIHLDAFTDSVSVRFRIDGVLRRASSLRPALFAAVSSRIKIMANLDIMERRLPQDGRLTAMISGESLDMRVSIVPIAKGESIVLRILGRKGSLLGLEELGFSESILSKAMEAVKIPHGLFLVTGPTGSGKTTTLGSLLESIRTEEKKIVSIEDPVEYVLDGVDQIQTNERIGLTFESLLRRVLRQDPDIILVGEIRDGATAELAVRAALTGHLVLSTLHTNDAPAAVPRLVDMGVAPYLLAAVLRGVLSQRLVRRICPSCREEYVPDGDEASFLDRLGIETRRLFRGHGCPECAGTGYRGRSAVGEVFLSDERLERIIAGGAGSSELRSWLSGNGFRNLATDSLGKALSGLTTLVEVTGLR